MSACVVLSSNKKLFLKDPDQTELGRKIIMESIRFIDENGFENFSFKKLSIKIHSTEASIYRYFENKHKLLVYLISCYWVWLDYQIGYHTNNIDSPIERLKIIIRLLADLGTENLPFTELNAAALNRLVICEASKAYTTKEVENKDKYGLFNEYKSLCEKITNIVKQINPNHPFPFALVTTIFEAAHQQIFFTRHMSGMTDLKVKNNDAKPIIMFLEHLAFSSLNQSSNTLGTNE